LDQEVKGSELLDRRTFRHAAQDETITRDEQPALAQLALDDGATITRRRLTALARAKIAFVEEAFKLCESHGCRAFASITTRRAPRPSADVLRKDYAYLLQRYDYFLEEGRTDRDGLRRVRRARQVA
jgi:hypothetical protein